MSSKKCSVCEKDLPIEKFSRRGKSSYVSRCKDCHNTYVREVWYPKNRDRQLAATKKWKDENQDRIVAVRYGCSMEQAGHILSINECEICGGNNNLVVDHNHATGELRGRLCNNCNAALGMFGDSIRSLGLAIKYLTKYGV